MVMMKVTSQLKDFQNETVQKMVKFESDYDGGFLLNEAGLGKSICVLGLMSVVELKTLIVCPAGLVDNWINEFVKHTNIDKSEIVRFYGPKRNNFKKSNSICESKQIWITSYTTLSQETKFMSKLNFRRIVLDEAHYIRNPSTNTTRKIFELVENTNSKRWVVTATPIYNGIKDAYSYFKFLNHTIDRADWRGQIGQGIQSVKKVNDLIKKYSICYKKVDVLQDTLKPKNEIDIELNFSKEEHEFYNVLKDYSRDRLEILIKQIKNVNTDKTLRKIFQMHVLTHILRLKQTCNSPNLVINKIKRLNGVTNVKQASEMLKYYNESRNIEQDCPICLDNDTNRIIDPCGHKFCNTCYEKLERHKINKCPMCRQIIISANNLDNIKINFAQESDSAIITSSKITKLCDLVENIIKKNEKVVIVSQWVEMLDLIKENPFFQKIKRVTLQGNRSIEERMDSIKLFENNSDVKICFLSMTSCAEGINLVEANHLILVDSWWNKALMIQVMNRIHRIGQNKDVNIYKMRIQNTIEEKIQKLVNKKHKITKNILGKYDEENLNTVFQEPIKLLDQKTKKD